MCFRTSIHGPELIQQVGPVISITYTADLKQISLNMMPAISCSRIGNRILIASQWIIIAVFANIFAASFVLKERYIYFWDLAEYWHDTSLMVYMFRRAPLGAISKLLYSVRHYDYNYLPTIPLTVPMSIFGESRLVYVLSIVNIYALPAAFVLTAATKAIAKSAGLQHAEALYYVVPVVLLTLPAFWVPTLRGYPDVGGLVLVGAVLFFYFNKRPRTLKAREAIVCGVLLALLLLFRRWYGFWAVSFIMLLPVDAAFELWNGCPFDFEACWKTYRPTILVVLSFGVALICIAWPLVVHMITTPYRDIYSAYRASTGLLESLRDAGRFYLGTLVCFAFAVSVTLLAASQSVRRLCVFLLAQLMLILILFERIQGFAWQHFYLLIPTIVIFLSLALVVIANMSSWLAVPMYSFVSIMAFGPVFSLYFGPLSHFSQEIAAAGRCFPLIRYDLPEIRRLLGILEDYDSRTGGTVYVLASSQIINSALLWEANLSLNTNYQVTGKILRTAEVDRRDGFPWQLLNAQYVLVAVPIQYHLRREEQRMVELPAEALLMGRNIGDAFERLAESFVLEGDVRVYVFRKVRSITEKELSDLEGECKRVYPDAPDICIPARR